MSSSILKPAPDRRGATSMNSSRLNPKKPLIGSLIGEDVAMRAIQVATELPVLRVRFHSPTPPPAV